jgi:hypothetical protein
MLMGEQAACQDSGKLLAFAKAKGFARFSRGGRGDGIMAPKLIFVDTLEDKVASDGKMSLREAVQTEGPRFVVFKVSGIIELTRPLTISEPYITIAGQTASQPGITLAHYGINVVDGCHDVVIRYLKIRTFFQEGDNGDNAHGILIYGRSADKTIDNVIVDHCSVSWATDENIDIHGYVGNYTIQHCIIAEGALYGHSKGPHSMGLLSGGVGSEGLTHGSICGNVFVHNWQRNPRISGGNMFEFTGNVVYNWYNVGAAVFDNGVKVDFTHNFYLPGKNSTASEKKQYILTVPPPGVPASPKLYLKNNFSPARQDSDQDETAIGIMWLKKEAAGWARHPADSSYFSDTPFSLSTVADKPKEFQQILLDAGARYPQVDKLDSRLIEEIFYVEKQYPDHKIDPKDDRLKTVGPNDGRQLTIVTVKSQTGRFGLEPVEMKQKLGQSQAALAESALGLFASKNKLILGQEVKDKILTGRSEKYLLEKRIIFVPDIETVRGVTPAVQMASQIDSDQDGLSDAWEAKEKLNPFSIDSNNNLIQDALEDTDRDGYLNIEEYIDTLVSISADTL